MKKVGLILIVSLLLPSMPLIASAEPPFGLAMERLRTIKKGGQELSEQELNKLLLRVVAQDNTSLKIKIGLMENVLSLAGQLFNRNTGLLPLGAASMIKRLEEMEDVPSTGSPSFKKAINQVVRIEARSADVSEQELADLSLSIWHEGTPLLQKKKEVKLLLYFASKSGFASKMPPVILQLIKEEEDFRRKEILARREEAAAQRKEAIKERMREREAEQLKQEKLETQAREARRVRHLKQEKLKMRAVEQCSKGWKARKPGRILGAFGINLGCKFDTEFSLGEHALTDGTPMYLFEPKNKFRSFSRYYVLITPKTHQVYSIWGMGDVKNTQTGQKEQAVILSILEKKYGKRKDSGIVGSLYDAESIVKGGKSIMLKVTGFTDTTLEVRYYDDTLKALAEKERIEIESSKVDDSGF